MGKKVVEDSKEVATVQSGEVAGALKVRAASIVDQAVEVGAIGGLPAEFDDASTLAGFPPSAKFEKKGDCVFGEFIGMRTDVGPNNSRLYELAVPDGSGSTMPVAVWGSAALDRLIDSAYPPIQSGDRIAVVYLGEKSTRRAQNPVKLFALKVKRAGMVLQETAAE